MIDATTMRVGFTGTRKGMTYLQRQGFTRMMRALNLFLLPSFHHGDCVGADADAHAIAKEFGFVTWAHPPEDEKLRAFCEADHILPSKKYHDRNRDIVRDTVEMIACPDGPEGARKSGTWYTIDFAIRQGRKVTIIMPNGEIIVR